MVNHSAAQRNSSTSTVRVAWSTAQRDALAAYVDRTSDVTRQLAARYVELSLVVGDSLAAPLDSFGGSSGSPAFASPPLRLGALDELCAIALVAERISTEFRRVLALPQNRPAAARYATAERLTWVAGVIGSVWDSDPSTGRTAAQAIWTHHAKAGRLLGLVSTAFRIEDACPACGSRSLWVDPDSWSVACGLGDCAYTSPIDARPVAWTST